MSRVGEQPIEISSGVTVTVADRTVTVKGSKGELTFEMPGAIQAAVEENRVLVTRPDDTRQNRSFHGLVRTLIANMIEGVSKGFMRELQIQGVGYKAEMRGQTLVMAIGFSSPVEYEIPGTVTVTVEGGTRLTVSGADKQQVGLVSARIRGFAPAEPYKGKGVLYKGEHIRRKVGKTVA